jgi:acetoacetate decarboxylase
VCGYRQLDGPCPKKYQFIRISDSTGFGDYTETGQVIPVTFRDRKGGYSHRMFLNDDPPIAGGRELWGLSEEAREFHAPHNEPDKPGRQSHIVP